VSAIRSCCDFVQFSAPLSLERIQHGVAQIQIFIPGDLHQFAVNVPTAYFRRAVFVFELQRFVNMPTGLFFL